MIDRWAELRAWFAAQGDAPSVPGDNYARMLYALAMSCSARTVVEIGAGPLGVSGMTFAHAMRAVADAANGPEPVLTSIEIEPDRPAQAWRDHAWGALGVDWRVVVGDSLTVPLGLVPVHGEADLLYIDGDHGGDHAIGDYRRFAPLVRPGGLIVFDDYHVATGVAAAVEALRGEGVHGAHLVYTPDLRNGHYVISVSA